MGIADCYADDWQDTVKAMRGRTRCTSLSSATPISASIALTSAAQSYTSSRKRSPKKHDRGYEKIRPQRVVLKASFFPYLLLEAIAAAVHLVPYKDATLKTNSLDAGPLAPDGGVGEIVRFNAPPVLGPVAFPVASVTVEVPCEVGVPEMSPFVLNNKPAGRVGVTVYGCVGELLAVV